MNPYVLAATTFAACGVEAVEALTIVLAVSITHGPRVALSGALASLLSLAAIVAIASPVLVRAAALGWLQLLVGLFLIYFGGRWLYKAILRYGGRKAMHDEDAIYTRHVEQLRASEARGAFSVAFGGVFVEGLEVVIIVVTFAASAPALIGWSIGGAIAAITVVSAAAVAIRSPLARVPENALKSFVAIMLLTLGTFWTGEGLRFEWWFGDATLIAIAGVYVAAGVLAVLALRSSNQSRMS